MSDAAGAPAAAAVAAGAPAATTTVAATVAATVKAAASAVTPARSTAAPVPSMPGTVGVSTQSPTSESAACSPTGGAGVPGVTDTENQGASPLVSGSDMPVRTMSMSSSPIASVPRSTAAQPTWASSVAHAPSASAVVQAPWASVSIDQYGVPVRGTDPWTTPAAYRLSPEDPVLGHRGPPPWTHGPKVAPPSMHLVLLCQWESLFYNDPAHRPVESHLPSLLADLAFKWFANHAARWLICPVHEYPGVPRGSGPAAETPMPTTLPTPLPTPLPSARLRLY